MQVPFEETYAGKLRTAAPGMTLIIPAARAVIVNERGEVLLIQRRDNGVWSLPAGGIELGDSIMDCLCREVREETGLEVLEATPIALYTGPQYAFINAWGNPHQMFSVVFRVDRWQGKLVTETDETVDARFFPLDALPEIPPHHIETLEDLKAFDGKLIVK